MTPFEQEEGAGSYMCDFLGETFIDVYRIQGQVRCSVAACGDLCARVCAYSFACACACVRMCVHLCACA